MDSKHYFDSIASEWDSLRSGFFSDSVREKALAAADIRPGQVAVDLGAGTGFITEGLLRAGLRVIAVDASQAMLEEVRRKFASSDLLDLRLGEAERLPVEDAAVDRVLANMYLHHVERPAHAIREMARILKPGGRLVITDLDEHSYEFLRTEQQDRWLGFKREDVRAWFEAAGLEEVRVDSLDENCCAESSCSCEKASVSIFAASARKP
jgi:ubiquinone/menaquinone biosynthesis C-methylase UbiE